MVTFVLQLQVQNNVHGLKGGPIIWFNCDKCEGKETLT